MATGNDRVKEGRSRIALLMDDDQLAAIDGIAAIIGTSRSQIIQLLVKEGLQRREFYDELRKYPDYVKYWLDCMALRPKDAFYRQPFLLEDEDEQGNTLYSEVCYEDMHDPDVLSIHYNTPTYVNELIDRREEIEALSEKYKDMFDQIDKDMQREQEIRAKAIARPADKPLRKQKGKK